MPAIARVSAPSYRWGTLVGIGSWGVGHSWSAISICVCSTYSTTTNPPPRYQFRPISWADSGQRISRGSSSVKGSWTSSKYWIGSLQKRQMVRKFDSVKLEFRAQAEERTWMCDYDWFAAIEMIFIELNQMKKARFSYITCIPWSAPSVLYLYLGFGGR